MIARPRLIPATTTAVDPGQSPNLCSETAGWLRDPCRATDRLDCLLNVHQLHIPSRLDELPFGLRENFTQVKPIRRIVVLQSATAELLRLLDWVWRHELRKRLMTMSEIGRRPHDVSARTCKRRPGAYGRAAEPCPSRPPVHRRLLDEDADPIGIRGVTEVGPTQLHAHLRRSGLGMGNRGVAIPGS